MTLKEFESLCAGDQIYNELQTVDVIRKDDYGIVLFCDDTISQYAKSMSGDFYLVYSLPDYKDHIAIMNKDLEELISTHKVRKIKMTDQDKKDLMLLSIKTFGEQSQFDQLHEEVGELMVALNHYKRGRVNLTKVIEEIVDVEQCLDTIKTLLQIDPEEYNTIENQQWNKMKKQIEERLT